MFRGLALKDRGESVQQTRFLEKLPDLFRKKPEKEENMNQKITMAGVAAMLAVSALDATAQTQTRGRAANARGRFAAAPSATGARITITDVNTGETRTTSAQELAASMDCPHRGRTIPQNIFLAYADNPNGSAGGISARPAKPGDKIPLNEIIDRQQLEQNYKTMGDLFIHIGPEFGNEWESGMVQSSLLGGKSYVVNGCDVGFIKGINGTCHIDGDTARLNPGNLDEYYIFVNPSATQLLGHSGLIKSAGAVGVGFIGGDDLICAGNNLVHNKRTFGITLADVFKEAGALYDRSHGDPAARAAGGAGTDPFEDATRKCNAISAKADALNKVLGVSIAGGAVSTVAAGVGLAGTIASGSQNEKAQGFGKATTQGGGGVAVQVGSMAGGLATTIAGGIGAGKLMPELKTAIKDCQDAVARLR